MDSQINLSTPQTSSAQKLITVILAFIILISLLIVVYHYFLSTNPFFLQIRPPNTKSTTFVSLDLHPGETKMLVSDDKPQSIKNDAQNNELTRRIITQPPFAVSDAVQIQTDISLKENTTESPAIYGGLLITNGIPRVDTRARTIALYYANGLWQLNFSKGSDIISSKPLTMYRIKDTSFSIILAKDGKTLNLLLPDQTTMQIDLKGSMYEAQGKKIISLVIYATNNTETVLKKLILSSPALQQ